MIEESGEEAARKCLDSPEQRELDQVSWALRNLAANLLRVTRGAGKADEIGLQAKAVVDAFLAYREVAGHFPSPYDLEEILSLGVDRDFWERLGEDASERREAKETIISGSLQIVASRFVGQKTQERSGDSEMSRGVRILWELRQAQLRK